MKKILMSLFLSFVALGLSVGDAEARRLGGGRSVGMQRQAVTPPPARPAQQQAAPGAPAGAPAAAAAPRNSWLGPIAGLAAGIGLAALFSHLGLGEGLANVVMIALLAMAALVVFRLLFRRHAPAAQPMQYAGGPAQGGVMTPVAEAAGSSATTSVPADFDVPALLRVAKRNYVRLQASNDARNLDDIREFTNLYDAEDPDNPRNFVREWSNSQNSTDFDVRALATRHFEMYMHDYMDSPSGNHTPLGVEARLRASHDPAHLRRWLLLAARVERAEALFAAAAGSAPTSGPVPSNGLR